MKCAHCNAEMVKFEKNWPFCVECLAKGVTPENQPPEERDKAQRICISSMTAEERKILAASMASPGGGKRSDYC
jgi:UPF0288 family protein (methanogenesis marker protein 3)